MRRLTWVLLLSLGACTPSIGDKCRVSTDCSIRGDRVCDPAQPEGYCTVLNCGGNACPDKATCVLFYPSVPGCGRDDRRLPRNARSFCMATCESSDDCRPGYQCADPKASPYGGLILDDGQDARVCIAIANASESIVVDADAAVCTPSGIEPPPIEDTPNPADSGDAGAGPDSGDARDAREDE